MTIMETAIEMNNDYVDCSNALNRIGIFSEAAYKEYEINLKEIALKVLKENGTEEDFDFLATEAAKDYIKRTDNAVKKTNEQLAKFIKNTKDRFIKMATQGKTKKALEKAEEACKANPKLRNADVEYHHTDNQVAALKQNLDKMRKIVAKVKARGIVNESDLNAYKALEDDTDKKIAEKSVIKTVKLSAAIRMFNDFSSKSEIDNKISDDVSDLWVDISKCGTQTPETADFFVSAVNTMGMLKKEIAAKIIEKNTTLFSGIRDAVNSFKEEVPAEKPKTTTESETCLEDLKMFSYVVESVEEEVETEPEEKAEVTTESNVGNVEGLDLDDYFEHVCNEVFSENAEESTEDVSEPETEVVEDKEPESTETAVEEVETESAETVEEESSEDMAKTYMEQLESEVFGTEEVVEESSEEEETIDAVTYMEQMEAELFGTDEEVVEESKEETKEESDDDFAQSLLDEMESLL